MNYKIRKAVPADLSDLIALCAEHAEFEQADYSAIGKKDKLAAHLFGPNPKLYCLIAEMENNLVGYATYTFEFSTWEAEFYIHMDCLFLRPPARGMGIGVGFIKEIALAANENQCTEIQWQTPIFNERAINFYHRLGAQSKKKLRFYFKPNRTKNN